jgi:hypothetical protein
MLPAEKQAHGLVGWRITHTSAAAAYALFSAQINLKELV